MAVAYYFFSCTAVRGRTGALAPPLEQQVAAATAATAFIKRRKRMHRVTFIAVVMLALLAGFSPAALATPLEAEGGYIVVLHERVKSPAATAAEIAGQVGGRVGYIYEHALKGFSIRVSSQAVAALQRNPNVKYVATDDVRYAIAQAVPTGISRIYADTNSRIGINGTDDLRVDADVAVIDTGIDLEHYDLNVAGGINCSGGSPRGGKCTAGGDDDHYHGTHVAGTIGALDNGVGVVGVAPGARLWAVKVLDARGSGWSSWIIAGIDWVAANADRIEVANMSLGGSGYNQAEYDAIQGAVNKGVAFAVAAGNSDDDARNYSPAAFNNVLTVSALADFDGIAGGSGRPTCRADVDDTLADFSNWGPAVGIAAPGICILSTYPLEKGEYGTLSGTSMASPHVAGALALLASAQKPANATEVHILYNAVKEGGNYNWTDDSGDGVQEPLLDVGFFAPVLIPAGGMTNNPPVVGITSPADGAVFASTTAISFSGSASDQEDGNLTSSLVWTSSLDGEIGYGGSFSTVLSDGIHAITAAVVDSGGLAATDSIAVRVGGGGIGLSVRAYKVKGVRYADLSWSGATTADVAIYRNGSLVATTPNDSTFTDGPLGKGGGSATYQVCEVGTANCSNSVAVTW